jgi:tripartite-type tricarboxylate transporter receptor subunit TctC
MDFMRSTLAVAVLAAPFVLADAAGAADFYAGKRITITVGFTTGGGYDAYARLLAKHYGKFIPGNPDVIVQNMPGASSLTSVTSLDANMPKDGTMITAFNPGLLIQSMTIPDKVQVNFGEFNWIGSIAEDLRVCYAWAASGIKTWDDMVKRPQVNMGDTGPGSSSYVNQKLIERIFGVKLNQVLGYPGSAEKRIAIERGELDGDCGAWTSTPPEWIRDNKIVTVIRFEQHVAMGLSPSVPYALDLVKDPDKKQLLGLLNSSADVGRPYIMSKDVPADRVKILRDAFDKATSDKAFLADADKQGLIVSPMKGVDVATFLKKLYGTPKPIIAAAKEITGD